MFLKSQEHRMKSASVDYQLSKAGLHVVPVSLWTMAEDGSKRVKIAKSNTVTK